MYQSAAINFPAPSFFWQGNDYPQPAPVFGRSEFPKDTVARIHKPASSVLTSAKERDCWLLTFDRRTAPYIEPLMGYTGGDETMPQVVLRFPTLKSAVAYARRQGLTYVIQANADIRKARQKRIDERLERLGRDTVLEQLGLSALHESYGVADPVPSNDSAPKSFFRGFATPMDVVQHTTFSRQKKLEILKDWEWDEYLIDLATAEGMPENDRPSRYDEIQHALSVLDREEVAVTKPRSKACEPLNDCGDRSVVGFHEDLSEHDDITSESRFGFGLLVDSPRNADSGPAIVSCSPNQQPSQVSEVT